MNELAIDLGIIADCKRFLECLNDKNVETIEHSDWVKHCQNNKQKHPFKLGEEDQVFCKPQQTIEYIGKLQMVKQLLLQTWDNIKCGQLNFIHLKITDNGLQAVV